MDHGGGTGGQYTVLRFVVDEQLDFGFPLGGILDFIKQQGGRLAVGIGALMKEREDFPERLFENPVSDPLPALKSVSKCSHTPCMLLF